MGSVSEPRADGGKVIPPKWQSVRPVSRDKEASRAAFDEMLEAQKREGAKHFRVTEWNGQVWLHGWLEPVYPPDWEEPFSPWMQEDKTA